MQQPLLAVRGEAVIDAAPEIARIEVSVAAVEADRATTARLLTERADAVDKVLASFPDIIEKTETSGIRVTPRLSRDRASRAGPGGQPPGFPREAGYHGAIYHVITVTGFDRLGELLAQLADLGQTAVGGPWWELRPGSPVHSRARGAAVIDAVRRARDYAAALGSELVGLVELADARLLSDSRGQAEVLGQPSPRLPQRVRTVAPEEFSVDLVPARQVVRATVEARFTISAPDLVQVDAPG